MSSATNAPMAAASVGVATPVNMDPNTAAISSAGGMRFFRLSTTTFFPSMEPLSSRDMGGPHSGLIAQAMATYAT